MKEENLDKFRKSANEHRIAPRPEAWQRLRHKLDNKKARMRVVTYRNVTVAAVMVAILCVVVMLNYNVDDHNPKVFSSNEQYRPLVMEDLVKTSDPFFNTENIGRLNAAYAVHR